MLAPRLPADLGQIPLHMTLADKSLAFALSIGGEWRDLGGADSTSYQRRYLYTQAFGAAHTAKSYWILHEAGQHSDCNALGRKLLEHLFNSRVASQSPRNAVELIAYELSERIRRLRLLMGEHKRVPREVAADVQRL